MEIIIEGVWVTNYVMRDTAHHASPITISAQVQTDN